MVWTAYPLLCASKRGQSMKYAIILIFLILISNIIYAQNENLLNDFEWMIKTIEENDAGYQYVIDNKGMEAYKKHNEIFREKIKKIENIDEFHSLLKDWITFFRNEHIGIEKLSTGENQQKKINNGEILETFEKTEVFDITLEDFKKYISEETKLSNIEGIWESGIYTIGIIKDTNNASRDYIGFIIEADGLYWRQGQVKIEIFESQNNYFSKYYMLDHSVRELQTELIDSCLLQLGTDIYFEKIYPQCQLSPSIKLYYELINAEKPFLKKISSKSIILRIPSFRYEYKTAIDSILNANHELITSHPNLIIDMRNNGGGSDAIYKNIIPYIYTNPIRIIGVEFLSTPLNNKRMDELKERSIEDKEWVEKSLKKLNNNIGKFVNLHSDSINITKIDTVFENPKNISIVINENCASSTEQFLLEAKQSRKVKLFGRTTSGVLDFANCYSVEFPSGNFKLWYSLSRTRRLPKFPIDDIGIQPDYYIDKSIAEHEWIKYILEMTE